MQQPVAPPPTAAPPVAASAPAPAPQTFAPPPEATGTLAPEHRLLVWPWLLAALVLAGAAAFLFWRNRSHRTALAGGPEIDLFGAPEPAPAPRPAPPPPPQPKAPEPPSPPVAAGIVSTGLRPWVDIRVQPLRCIITDQDATIEFELELFNSGSAPARGIHVAVALINAGEGQEEALSSFFAQEPGPGERMEVIQPLKRANFATQITIPRDQVRPLEMAGRQMFVPVLAFNAHYVWGSKAGQTSVSYLVGRDANGGKMSPFRLDLGPRVFRGLGARLLPTGIRS